MELNLNLEVEDYNFSKNKYGMEMKYRVDMQALLCNCDLGLYYYRIVGEVFYKMLWLSAVGRWKYGVWKIRGGVLQHRWQERVWL